MTTKNIKVATLLLLAISLSTAGIFASENVFADTTVKVGKDIVQKELPEKTTHPELEEMNVIAAVLYSKNANHSAESKQTMEDRLEELQQQLYDKVPKMTAEKRQLLTEKHDIFNDKVTEKLSDKSELVKFRSDLPFQRMSIDEFDGTLKFGFLKEDLTDRNTQSYLKQIREIVGNDVDVKIYVAEKAKTGSCSTDTSNCTPMEGGIQMSTWTEAGSIGFQAKRLEGTTWKEGFITAGHNADGSGSDQTVYQALTRSVGTLELESFQSNSYCDCAWVEVTSYGVDDSVFTGAEPNAAATPTVNTAVTAYGYVSDTLTGIITDSSDNVWVSDEDEGDVYLRGQLVMDFVMQDGDSGGPVYKTSGSDLVGIMSSYDTTQSWVSNVNKLSSLSSSVQWDFN